MAKPKKWKELKDFLKTNPPTEVDITIEDGLTEEQFLKVFEIFDRPPERYKGQLRVCFTVDLGELAEIAHHCSLWGLPFQIDLRIQVPKP